MMRLLLDTHVFLWYITDDPKLPVSFAGAIRNLTNEVYLSVASIWEAVIKHGLGKLPLPSPADRQLIQQRTIHGINPLPIDEGAMAYLANLPVLRRDPFDRIIVAQALQFELTIATVDSQIAAYPVIQFPLP